MKNRRKRARSGYRCEVGVGVCTRVLCCSLEREKRGENISVKGVLYL